MVKKTQNLSEFNFNAIKSLKLNKKFLFTTLKANE